MAYRAGGLGPISALVGVDGSVEAAAAACTVIELFGPRLGHLTLGTVTDLEAAESAASAYGQALSSEARAMLEHPATYVGDFDPDTILLAGEPADALLDYALDQDIDLLAVGSHGRGLSKAVLGNVRRAPRAATGRAGPCRGKRNAEKRAENVSFRR